MFRMHGSFACAVVLLAASARADPTSPPLKTDPLHDRIVDRDESVVPNDDTSVKLATGETKHLAGPDPEKASVDVHLTSSADGPGGRVSVGMSTDDPRVTLFRLIDRIDIGRVLLEGVAFVPVLVMSQQPISECAAPCNKSVDPRFSYLVAGEGITPSSPFRFPPEHSAYKLEVDAGSSSAHAAGVVLTTAGICLAALGGAFLAVDAVDSESPAVISTGGAVGAGLGVISMAVGIPLWLSSGTSVHVNAAMNEPELRLPAAMALRARGITF